MYLIADVPEGATALHFSILNTAEFDKVVLSNSDRIEDMELMTVPESSVKMLPTRLVPGTLGKRTRL